MNNIDTSPLLSETHLYTRLCANIPGVRKASWIASKLVLASATAKYGVQYQSQQGKKGL